MKFDHEPEFDITNFQGCLYLDIYYGKQQKKIFYQNSYSNKYSVNVHILTQKFHSFCRPVYTNIIFVDPNGNK